MFGHTLLLLYNNVFPDNDICNIVIYTDDASLYSNRVEASDLWQEAAY